jgi:hypothetical protein
MIVYRFNKRLRIGLAGRMVGALSLLLASTAATALVPAAAARAEVTIDRIEPAGGPRGTELEIRLAGKEFVDPEQLWFEDGAIAVLSLTAVDATHVQATIRIPEDCPLGLHRMRLRTKRALSELRMFRVGSLPQSAEVEPNNDPVSATSNGQPPAVVHDGRTITGVIKGEDIDCFPVRAAAGERISVAIDGIRLDQEMFDPFIEIVDDRGFVLAACDDHPLLGQDAMLAVTAPADGIYYLRVRESAYGGNDGCVYLLHVGRFPVPHVAWPPGGLPGAKLDVEWLGDPAGPFRTTVVLPKQGDLAGLAEVWPERNGLVSPVGVPFRISSVAATTESEPNDEPGLATRVSAPANVVGRMAAAEDVDWIRVEAAKGSSWRIRGRGRRLGSPIDLVVNLHRDDAKREKITGNDDADGPDSDVRVKTPDQGSFLIRINDHQRRGGAEFVYWIDIEPSEPGVTVSVPPGRSNSQERLVASIPRGNRTALVFNTTRNDYDQDVQLAFSGLPAGVRAIVSPAVAKAPGTIVVFEATAEAAPAASMATVAVQAIATGDAAANTGDAAANTGNAAATTGDAAATIGGLRQTTELVFGQPNNATYRTSVSDRLPVAVVEGAQIRIEVEPPVVPLVRRGSMDLRVKIVREPGFTGKVKLALPFKPPGIGAAAAVEVGENETEAVYPINATADASLNEWPLVVTAAVKAKDSLSGWVSSLPVTVRVAEPLVELAAEKAVTEPGRDTQITYKVTKSGSFEGLAKVKLMGLPAKTEAPELDLAATATELVFPVSIAADAPVGRHENVFCQVRVPMAGTWVVHSTPGTHLRIDKALTKPSAKPSKASATSQRTSGTKSAVTPKKESGS